MKYGLTLFILAALAGSLALPQSSSTTPAKKTQTVPGKTAPKTPAAKKVAPRTASSTKKATTSKTTASKKTVASKKGKSGQKVPVSAYRQVAPTPERYREIQQALADKGYLKSEPNGVWDDQSAEALRQFQTEQKLSPTGKLSSASLIALGLGPKTSTGSPSQPAATIEAPPAPTPEN
jgi:hypothetical protein